MSHDEITDAVVLRTKLMRAVFLVVWSPRIVLVCTLVVMVAWFMRDDVVVYSSSTDGRIEQLNGEPLTQDVVDKVMARKELDAVATPKEQEKQ